MAEKAVYSLTSAGEREFEKLMSEIACKPINIFLDFNAVIVNLDSLTPADQKQCLDNIEANIKNLKGDLEENMALKGNRQGCAAAAVYAGRGHRGLDRSA